MTNHICQPYSSWTSLGSLNRCLPHFRGVVLLEETGLGPWSLPSCRREHCCNDTHWLEGDAEPVDVCYRVGKLRCRDEVERLDAALSTLPSLRPLYMETGRLCHLPLAGFPAQHLPSCGTSCQQQQRHWPSRLAGSTEFLGMFIIRFWWAVCGFNHASIRSRYS